jgi:hypothetical protein
MRTITDLLRLARGDFRGEPAQLIHKKSVFDRRLEHADEAASRRGGIGINSAVELRGILQDIQDEARSQSDAKQIDEQEFQRLCNRVDAVRQKLSRAEDNRAKKLQARNEERDRLLAGAIPPFEAPPGFKWQVDVVDGRVEWWFVSPIRFHLSIKKKGNSDGPTRLSTDTAA